MSFGASVTTLDNTTVTDGTLIPCSKSDARNEITVAHFRTYIFTSPTFTAPALGTPASGDFSTGSFTWPTFNQNTTGTAAIATTITAADEASDSTCFIVFVTAATGNLGPKTNSGITFNSTTGVLTATGFSGPLTGNVTGNASGSSGSCTGNAATATALATARAIYGNNFDGTAALTQIIASTYGGTGNGFTKFSGPTTAERTFTLPDASATLLYGGGALGTPSSGTLTNCSGLPIGGIASLGTGVGTALGVNVGSAGAFVVNGGALGTPSSGTLTSCTGLPVSTGISGLGTGVATALAANTNSSGGPVTGGAITTSGLTMATARLLGRTTASTGAVEELTPGTGVLTAIAANTNATDGITTPNGTATLTNKIYSLAAVPGTDDTWEGTVLTGRNAGATIAQWEAVYLDSSGTWQLADANGSGTFPAVGLSTAAYSSTNAATVLVWGVARNDAWNWTVGGLVYLSGTVGGLTQTVPSTSGDKVQIIGVALSADTIFVRPSLDYLTVT